MSSTIVKSRVKAFNSQGGLCYYCKSPMWQKSKKKFAEKYDISELAAIRFQCTAEHLKARADGGGNDTDNIVAACYFCNPTRHARKNPPDPLNYRAYIQRRLKKRKWHSNGLHLHFV